MADSGYRSGGVGGAGCCRVDVAAGMASGNIGKRIVFDRIDICGELGVGSQEIRSDYGNRFMESASYEAVRGVGLDNFRSVDGRYRLDYFSQLK